MAALLRRIREILRSRRFRKKWYRILSGFAALIVFITTYALVLPAITLEKTAECGMEEHQHDDSCYEEVLVCGQEESEGHHHDDSCYTVTKELVCGTEEHQHSAESGCYDGDGNLICEIAEHVHDESCYEEVKTLTCGLEESEGHHHDASCYEKVLVCEKEVHVHSEKCYEGDSTSDEGSSNPSNDISTEEQASDAGEADDAGSGNTASTDTAPDNPATDASSETIGTEPPEGGYVPELNAIEMETVLSDRTGFYYYHAGEGEETPSSSAQINDWKKLEDDTILESTDLVKMWLAYTIPAGALNETNRTARYRLPANLHLTDGQIDAINKTENGIAAGMAADSDEYQNYLGVEAVEGTRTPDEVLVDGSGEYISAVVRAENVYIDGEYAGQDLIFVFTPYTIEKNRNTFDDDGNPVTSGEAVRGWLTCDFNMQQIDWAEEETARKDDTASEEEISEEDVSQETGSTEVVLKKAEVVFVKEDKQSGIEEIRRTLRQAEERAVGSAEPDEDDKDEQSPEEVTGKETGDETGEEAGEKYESGTLTAEGDGYRITLDYDADAHIPGDASLSVREITADTDREAYEACLAQAEQQVADDGTKVDQKATRFFDIEILVRSEQGEDEKIEPAAPVKVNIQLTEAPASDKSAPAEKEDEAGDAQSSDPTVLHFAEEGIETIDATVTDEKKDEKANEKTNEKSEDTSTEISFETESFSIYGVVYTAIRKTFISASGQTYEIIVTYGEDAEIPDDAELSVKEILSTDEEYASLYNSAALKACSDAEKQGIDMPIISNARLFDIEIQGEDGKIEPSAPVQVYIRLAGTAAGDHTSVVHFGEDGTEALETQTPENPMPTTRNSGAEGSESAASDFQGTDENTADESTAAEGADGAANETAAENAADETTADEDAADEPADTEISFQTDSFSVYSVVNVTNMGSIAGNGKKYALVSGIANDPGATTGYSETWGRDYFTIIVNAHAVSDQLAYDGQNRVDGLQVEPVHAYEDGSISYVGGDPAQWQFESAGNGKYYLSVNGKYLQRYNKNGDQNYGWEARLVDDRNNATQLSITVNSDGTICIYDDIGGNGQQYYLHNDGNGEFAGRTYKFTNQNVNTNSAAFRFRVCSESDQFDSFAARKVSVQNLTVNDNFLIYRRFEDSQGNEQLYALASDGTFVRVYDGGDTVYWRETDKNIYWNYRLEGNYYSIYSTNPSTNATVYINPLDSSEPPQLFTSEPSRLTLIGKDNGEYGTTIENWDQTKYDYAGLHVTVDSQSGPSLSTGTRGEGTSDTFLFAVASSMPGATAEPVSTVDSDSLGIKITMFDYGDAKGNYNAGDKLSEMTNIAGSAEYTPHEAHALVKPYLESGLPSSTSKGAMTGLFTTNGSAVTAYKENVNHLFLQSYYDENGMFRYRSEDNYAYLPYDPDTETITGTDFTVYRQAATPYPNDVSPGHTYYTHGHFMPFNDIDMNQHSSRLMNQYGNEYDPDDGKIIGELPVGDGRTYEDIYGVQGTPNFYTGMKMESDFTQLKDGKCENGDPMVFKFTGDDDMWVYIDGVLVLDVGGIHEPLSGSIDFSTGQVVNPDGSSLAGTKNLKTIFMDTLHALQNIPSYQRTQEQNDLIARIQSIEWKGNTFADYTNHDFKAFYMERGAGASNLDIQFNLKVVRADEFVVEKQITDGVDKRFVNQKYKFRATFKDYKDNDNVKPLFAGQKDKYGDDVCTGVYYRDRKDDEGNPVAVDVDQDGYFTLNVGEAAIFKMADQNIEYSVSEVEIDPGLTRQVEVNGKVVTVSNETAEAAYARVGNRSQLNYKNHPFLQNLNIIKHLLPQNTQAGAGDVFEFRVYLETVLEQEGEMVHQLVPYSYGPYYVTQVVGGQTHYFTMTGQNNAPVDKGTTPVVCSTTGRSGSINSIPPEYTVVIPNLAVGTHFYIEERRDNMPAGYSFDHEDLLENTYDAQTLGSNEEIISRILARDEKDHQAFDPDTIGKIKKDVDAQSEVFNKKVFVNVQKQWLKTNGQPYTLSQARQLPGSTNAVVTAELWRKKNTQETSGETDTPVTVTFMVNTTENSEYRQVSVPVTIKNNSTLEFSLGANKTSQAQEIHTAPAYSVSRTSVTSDQKITYSNGRKKDKWSKYTISGITEDTTVYATFDAAKVSDDFVGLYIAAMEEPNASTVAPSEEKVADITLNNGNDWLQQVSMEQGYTYFLMNVVETGLADHEHEYTFIDAPTVTTDANGNLILAVANKYREPANITVEKIWSPALTSEEEANAHVKVELHRYAKKSKGLFEVVLKDNYGAPIEGAEFKLYKDGVEQEEEYVTDVNGKVTAGNLEPGTYVFKQTSTPEGYNMPDPAPSTDEFVVTDNTTSQQHMLCELQNQALATNGVAVLTLLDNNGDPVQGAKYNLIKKENNGDVIVYEGLETDENGQITVSQLGAGTYYFYETEPPADYNLPNDWQDTDFTVVEHPGIVQRFNISMINNLKGKGYVNVILTGPEGRQVSGATFELYKGSEKLDEKETNDSGQLTFGSPDKLPVGTYYVKQVTTDSDLLPASQQSFTIYDNGNANQPNELNFTNPYRGKGRVTVTLTRKDNNNPISGATFELYKDGEKIAEKETNGSGQLTFGDPDKLPAGNYSIKQTSTAEGLQPVVNNWPFQILENGDPNQTKSWEVQNEDEAGNVTIKLWRKQGLGQYNWEQVGDDYVNLKPGKTYNFTAELNPGLYPSHCWYLLDETENNYYRNLQAYELTGISQGGTWNSSNNTYHFSITPTKDNTTYSYVLATDWGTNDIKSMTMDEGSRGAAASASGTSKSQQAGKLAVSKTRLQESVKDSAQMAQGNQNEDVQNDSLTPGNGNAAATGKTRKGSSLRDVPVVVSPSGPPNADYIVDSSFKETYTITKADDNWKHVFENLDKCDQDENPYYYYVIETECVPDTYHLISYSNDNLSTTGTITVTNEIKRGALTIEKHVTVNHGAVPNDAKTIADGDYTFTVTGPNGYSQTATVTISQGQTNTTILNDLVPGTYTITETGTTNRNGVTLVTNPVQVTVAPDSQASANIASFTNDLETTSIKVKKQWMNANGSPVSNTSSVITFTLNQVSYVNGSDTSFTEVPYAGEYPHEIVGNDEVEITNLPVKGTREDGTQVNYAYTIRENQDSIPGYHDTYGTSDDGKEWTIYNTPAASTDQNDPLSVTKLWQDMNGTPNNGVHGDDEVTFTVTRHAVAANDYVPVTLSLFNSDSQGTAAQVKVYYVKKNSNVTLRFYNGDSRHFLTLSGAGSSDGRYIGEDRLTALYDWETTFTVSGPMSLTAQLSDREWGALLSRMHDTWVVNAGHAAGLPASTKWDYSISASGTKSIYEDAKLLAEELKGGEQLGNQPSYTYTMKGGNQITEGADFDPQASGWIATLTGLPTFAKVGDHYETYTYTISEVKVNGKTVTYSETNANQGDTEDYQVTLDPDNNTITNREKPVKLEFTKRWLDADEQVESWPDQTITVTVKAKSSAETKEYVYQIGKNDVIAGGLIQAVSPADAPKLKVESIADNNYKFSLENLPRTDSSRNAYVYTIGETDFPDGYLPPRYFDSNGDPIGRGGTTIQSGGTIVNAVGGYELPNAGGPGTRLFTILGSILIAGAGLLLWRRRRAA